LSAVPRKLGRVSFDSHSVPSKAGSNTCHLHSKFLHQKLFLSVTAKLDVSSLFFVMLSWLMQVENVLHLISHSSFPFAPFPGNKKLLCTIIKHNKLNAFASIAAGEL
jgi:hypothetical protein